MSTIRTLNTRSVRDARLDEELEAEIKANQPKVDNEGNPVAPEDENLSKEEKSWKKRHDDMKSYMQKQINDLSKELNSVKTQLVDAAKKQIKFPETEEEVEAWAVKYPKVAGIVKTIAMKEVASSRTEVEELKQTLEEQKYQVEYDKNLNRILKAHSDFFELHSEDKFTEWLETQPKSIRLAFGDNLPIDELEDAADTIIHAVKSYKLENKKVPETPKRDDRREAARQVTTKNGSAPKMDRDPNLIYESEVIAIPIKHYTDEIDEEVNKARREGRFVYDVTGAAR